MFFLLLTITISASSYYKKDQFYPKSQFKKDYSFLAKSQSPDNYEQEIFIPDSNIIQFNTNLKKPEIQEIEIVFDYNLSSEERLLGLDKEYIREIFFEFNENNLDWASTKEVLTVIEDDFEEYATEDSSFIEKIKIEQVTLKKYPLLPHNDVAIEISNKKRVDAFIKLYTVKKRKTFLIGLNRAQKYYKMVQKIFTEYNIPHDIFYLAMVESNFNYKAVSHASAVGLWQFIGSTGRLYGMRYNWWYDDRLDPEKATVAAARFLTDLYKRYNNWALALAAYNSGLGKVDRAIVRNKKLGKPTDYWSLKLPRETRGYVPAFLAVVHIFNNLEKYNFLTEQKLQDWPKYKTVAINNSVSFEQINQKTGISVKQLKNLNPLLKYNFTPYDGKKKFMLKIPAEKTISNKQIASLKPDNNRKFISYKVVRGDTLWNISRRYKTSLKDIYLSNPRVAYNKYLKPGQKIILPINKNSSNNIKTANNKKIHVVLKGDTLWGIARKYRISMTSLVKKNYHLNSLKDSIRIGSKIIIN